MKRSNHGPWLIKLAVILILPTVACFGWYSQQVTDSPLMSSLLVLALPVALIALMGLSPSGSADRGRPRLLWLMIAGMSIALLLWAWG